MAKTYSQLKTEMQRLQKQMEVAKASEVSGVIARIREAIEHYELTPDQLFGEVSGKRTRRRTGSNELPGLNVPKKAKAKSAGAVGQAHSLGAKLPVKFRDDSGNTWTGRGSTPRWLAQAIASGKAREDFEVKS